LSEVFGYPVANTSPEAQRIRQGMLCPFHNPSGQKCTKSSAIQPIGVCTIVANDKLVATCPVRFSEDHTIITDATDFFFPGGNPVVLREVRLRDKSGKTAGDIDIVLATVDGKGNIMDFGAIEIQAVYISGNVRN